MDLLIRSLHLLFQKLLWLMLRKLQRQPANDKKSPPDEYKLMAYLWISWIQVSAPNSRSWFNVPSPALWGTFHPSRMVEKRGEMNGENWLCAWNMRISKTVWMNPLCPPSIDGEIPPSLSVTMLTSRNDFFGDLFGEEKKNISVATALSKLKRAQWRNEPQKCHFETWHRGLNWSKIMLTVIGENKSQTIRDGIII